MDLQLLQRFVVTNPPELFKLPAVVVEIFFAAIAPFDKDANHFMVQS